jgi:hypothetical protein
MADVERHGPQEIDRRVDGVQAAVDDRVVVRGRRLPALQEEKVTRVVVLEREAEDGGEAVLPRVELETDGVRVDGGPAVDEGVDEKLGDDVATVTQAEEVIALRRVLSRVAGVPALLGRCLGERLLRRVGVRRVVGRSRGRGEPDRAWERASP